MSEQLLASVPHDAFQAQAAALGTLGPADPLRPFEPMFEPLRRCAAARRRAVQRARQAPGDDSAEAATAEAEALQGFSDAVRVLSAQADTLRSTITPALDDVIALAADERHPLRAVLARGARAFGISSQEAGWLFDELEAVGFRPVSLVCAGGFEDLQALLAGISTGEPGLLAAGFARLTGDPATDERLEKLVLRLAERGLTASLFLALVIILAARTVAIGQSAD